MDGGARGRVKGGDEVEPLLAGGVIPDWWREVDVVELCLVESDGEEELPCGSELPVGFAFFVVIGEEEGVELAVE